MFLITTNFGLITHETKMSSLLLSADYFIQSTFTRLRRDVKSLNGSRSSVVRSGRGGWSDRQLTRGAPGDESIWLYSFRFIQISFFLFCLCRPTYGRSLIGVLCPGRAVRTTHQYFPLFLLSCYVNCFIT